MSNKGQAEAAPARAVETQHPVESRPALDVAAVSADKMQSEVYKPPGQDGSRIDFNQAVIAASFAPGSPEELRDPNNIGDFRNYRTMMDSMWLGSNKMGGVERVARAFAGVGMLPMPDDKGLQCQTAGANGSECTYKASERKDGLSKLTRSRADGIDNVTREYQGRSDHLLNEKFSVGKDFRSFERQFEPGKGPGGLTSEKYLRTSSSEGFERNFDPVKNKENVQTEKVTREGGVVTVQKAFNGRSDGVTKETTEFTGLGATSVREMADGTKQQRALTPEQIKASGIDILGLTTTGDAALRTKKAFEISVNNDTKLQTEAAAGGNAVQEILKKTVGDKSLNDPSFDGMAPPSPRDKAVMLIGAEAGCEGLKKAGMTVDEQTNTATTADGCRYTFEKQPDGKLGATSVESEKNNRKIEFQYKEDGAFKGSIETAKLTDGVPGRDNGPENGAGRKYENLELPAIQKGWGPYQALQQMRKEGKIQMSPQEMKQEAVRIRDREFARLGRNYFKVGETFSMYSPEEMGANAGPTTVRIHRDASGNLLKMERGDKATVNFGYDDKGKPSRVSDGIGPDLVSRDGGQSWEFENKSDSANRGLTPALKGKITVQPDKGTVTVNGEDNLKFTIGADGTRTFTGPGGKETVLFRPARAEVPERGGERGRRDRGRERGRPERGREGERSPRGREGSIPASSEYDEGAVVKRGDSTPHQRGRGKPGPDGTIAQRYINQENIDPQMRAVRAPDNAPPGGMKLRGSPTISAEKIDEILKKANSPAARERIKDQETGKELTFGQHLYKLGVEYGVDPAITLGFFKAESGFGKAGAAVRNNSVGNIKGDGGFRQYGSFAEGARDWFKLMQDGREYFKKGRETVGAIIPKYAPRSDNNDEAGYIKGVERNVRDWSRQSAHAPDRAAKANETGDQNTRETAERNRERQRQQERTEVAKPDDRGRPVIEVKAGESIQAALDKAQEGSIIRVAPGVYKERLNIKKDNISLRGDGKAIIDLDGQNISGAAINISDRKGVAVDGFEIRNVRGGDTPAAIKVEGASRDISITNNNIHHIENAKNAHGIAVFGTAATPMRNINIAGNEVHNLKLGSSEAIAVNGNVDGFRITGNKVHDNDNIGIDVIGFEGVGRAGVDRARNGIISGNTVYNIDSKDNPAYKGERSAAGIYVDGGSDIIIENNTVKNSNYGIELASEHQGKNTSRIQVRRNLVEGSHLAGISLGGGSTSNGGVNDSIIENNDFRNNSRPLWRQNNVGSDIIYRNNDAPIPAADELPPIRRETATPIPTREVVGERVVRDIADRNKFYAHQNDSHSCSAFSMAMMAGDHLLGRPPQYGNETQSFKALAGVLNHGYRGSLETMAGQLRQVGMETKAYQYNRFGPQGMQDLNAELDQGHSAVARVINPRTGNRHYIYVAGRNTDGNYILGDPDRGNTSHSAPVSPERLMKMMSGRDGFVAGWAASDGPAISVPGTAAYKRALARNYW